MREALNLRGVYRIDVVDKITKSIVSSQEVENLITTAGKNAIASHLVSPTDPVTEFFQFVGFGDNNTTPVVANTQLNSEVGRVAFYDASVTANVIEVFGKLENADLQGFTLREIGIFVKNATQTADTGTLFSHALITPIYGSDISKTSTNEVNVTYTLTIN